MTIKASGSPLAYSEITAEFGSPPGNKLGSYRISQTVSGLTNLPLDTGIPQSGTIKFSDFYSKRLNVVVDYTSSGIYAPRSSYNDAVAKYNDNSGVTVIGGFATKPTLSSLTTGKTVWIHTNSSLGSDQSATTSNNINHCALLTGSWPSLVNLKVDIGPSGNIYGAGGPGGTGGRAQGGTITAGAPGKSGDSALGVTASTTITITNRGRIAGGGGGGGGGGGAYGENRRRFGSDQRGGASGGGGGGGRGYPGGTGGSAGPGDTVGQAGQAGNTSNGGNGGAGGVRTGQTGATGGTGGSGSTAPNTGGTGGNGIAQGRNGGGARPGAVGGAAGYAIVISNNGSGVTVTNTGTLNGNIQYNTNPV